MESFFADRIANVPRSFIREMLKVTLDRSIISFAGGLPNRALFPAAELKQASGRVLDLFGPDVFQYSNSEGYSGLKELISRRYREKKNLDIPPENILITNGSQQGLDLLGKTFINEGDDIIIEEPGYLGAIQAFSIYRPRFNAVPLQADGPDIRRLRSIMTSVRPKLMYSVPDFQNPSGLSYSGFKRSQTAEIIRGSRTLLVEDDPYSDLRYSGEPRPSFKTLLPENTILLGTFSKTVVPGFRLGWIAAPDRVLEKLIVAKQAADLHTCQFTQYIIYQYLKENDIEKHIGRIREAYGRQLQTMLTAMAEFFPPEAVYTRPEGGMFIWVTLPEGFSSRDLLELAMKEKVIFVPGDSFYVDNRSDVNTLRINFTCTDEETIRTGIRRLGDAIRKLMKQAEGAPAPEIAV